MKPRKPRRLRAVVYTDAGQVVLIVSDLTDLARQAIAKGLVKL